MNSAFALCVTFLNIFTEVRSEFSFRNVSLSWDERVNDLISHLTIHEMVEQMTRGGSGNIGGPTPEIKRLGINPYPWNSECLHGEAFSPGDDAIATTFPEPLGLAAAFSNDLIFKMAEATATEVRARYNNLTSQGIFRPHNGISCFSPVINIMRHPLWGRNQETYGEDPFLSGSLATSYVKGLQGSDPRYVRANAGCKHFDGHGGPENIPVSRYSFDAKISERDLRLTFLPQFKMCIEAGSYGVMCSYNSVNGVPACANKYLLTDILRKEWGFKGYVVSDRKAIENIITEHHYLNNSVDTAAACVNAGCNLELSANLIHPVFEYMEQAIEKGILTNKTVTEMVKPLFYTRMRLGEFDPPNMNPYTSIPMSVVAGVEHRHLAITAAKQSFVLLKNDGFLPVKHRPKHIAVIGPLADSIKDLFGDFSAHVVPQYSKSPLDGLRLLADGVSFASGCDDATCLTYTSHAVRQAISSAGVEFIVVCVGTGKSNEREGEDRAGMMLPGHQTELLRDVVQHGNGKPIIVIVFSGGPVDITFALRSSSVHAVMQCFFPAQAAGEAIRAVLMNDGPDSNPAGRLPYTWPTSISQVPPMIEYAMTGRTYRYFHGTPLFPFGYGLSYSKFRYNSLELEKTSIQAGDDLNVNVTVENTSPLSGDEVVQAYVSWPNASSPMPRLQLVAFKRVLVSNHKILVVNLIIKGDQMAVWDDHDGFIIEPGKMLLYVGGQQPNQTVTVGSNTLETEFTILGKKILNK